MIHVELRFPTGRFHATPPDHHVNEGFVEWPPSPWRFARGLLATGFRSLGWPVDSPPAAARDLFSQLASAEPRYILPERTGRAETRSWAPAGDRKALLLDAFCVLRPGDRVVMSWDIELDAESRALLDALLERLPYLGRAESLVVAQRVSTVTVGPEEVRAEPARSDSALAHEDSSVELLAPLSPRELLDWRHDAAELAQRFDPGTPRRVADRLKRIETLYPAEVAEALMVASDRILKERWSAPPGSTRVLYDLPSTALPRLLPGRDVSRVQTLGAEIHVARYFRLEPGAPAVAALGIAERIHRRIAEALGASDLDLRARLLGLDPSGRPLRGHRHLRLLPHRENTRLVGLLAHLPAGWTRAAWETLRAHVRGRPEAAPTQLTGTGQTWISSTPFLSTHHPRRGRWSPEDQLRSAIEAAGWPAPTRIQTWSSAEVRRAGFFSFSRSRVKKGRHAPLPRPHGFTLNFAEPVAGPFAAGYGLHFGLGTFALPQFLTQNVN